MIENVIEFFKNLPAKVCTLVEKKLTNSTSATVTNATLAIFYDSEHIKQPQRYPVAAVFCIYLYHYLYQFQSKQFIHNLLVLRLFLDRYNRVNRRHYKMRLLVSLVETSLVAPSLPPQCVVYGRLDIVVDLFSSG